MTQGIFNIPFLAVAALIGIGLYIIVFDRNLIKLVIGITVLQAGVNLFLVSLGYRQHGGVPIYTNACHSNMVLPVPQALTLTSIVIGVAITAFMLSMIMIIYRHTGHIDAKKSRKLKG
ncbi:MAG: cation:proton antiporter subunit C [Desulfobacterales bacterium]|nr:cation:proton antiporter subunit C [Desulfobacterales bacterium]